MSFSFDNITFEPPNQFLLEESSVSFFASPEQLKGREEGKGRPNFIVQRQRTIKGENVSELAQEVKAGLESSGVKFNDIKIEDFSFQDGTEGALLSYYFVNEPDMKILQFQAIRLDEGIATTATLTTDAAFFTGKIRRTCMKSLSSVVLERSDAEE